MATTLIVKTQFTAVDKLSATMKRMTSATVNFGKKTVATFARVERASRRLNNSAKNLSDRLFNLRNAAGVLAAGFAIKKTFDMASGVAAVGDEAAKTSRMMGLSAEALQEFRFAADRQGVSNSMLDKSFIALQKRVGELKLGTGSLYSFLNKTGNQALIKQLKTANSTEEAFTILQKAINGIEDPTQKAAFAAAAFSRSGVEMLKFLDAGEMGIKGLREEARKYGGVISNDAAKASEDFIDAQTNMNFALDGLKATIGVALMPKVKEIIEGISDWTVKNKGLLKVKVESFVKKLSKGLDFLWKNASKIVTTLKILIGVFVALKAVMFATNAIMAVMKAGQIAYNIAIGSYKAIAAIATAAQWAWNVAMNANPIGIVIIAITALIAIVATLITYWEDIVNWVMTSDNWFAKIVRGSINALIIAFRIIKNAIMIVIETFKYLINWVKTSDNWFAKFVRGSINALVTALTAIGNAFSWIWEKIKKAWDILMKFFNTVGEVGGKIAEFFGIGGEEDVNVNKNVSVDNVPEAASNQVITQKFEQSQNGKVEMNINDKSGVAEVTKEENVNVKLTKTVGFE